MTIKINEIFYSIQGESSYAGWPCVFVRLTGCNLRCSYCDSHYAFYDGTDMSIPEIIKEVEKYNCNLVEVTGGEPLLQNETPDLIRSLLDAGYRVLVETNGSQNISVLDERAVTIMDIKCPFSEMVTHNDLTNLSRLRQHDEVKFVIGSIGDYRFARKVLNDYELELTDITVHFAPVDGKMPASMLADWILGDGLNVRLNLQLHKIIEMK